MNSISCTSILTFGGNPEFANAAVVQSDGKLLLGGGSGSSANAGFEILRFNTNNTLDNSFGVGGKVMADFGGRAAINAMAVQPDGQILVAGNDDTNFAAARYQTNGALDPSFGAGGTVITHFAAGVLGNGAAAVLLLGSGEVVAMGAGGNANDFVLAMYNTNGVLDTNFNGTERVFTAIPGATSSAATAVGLQLGNNTPLNPNRLVVAGTAFYGTTPSIAVARYNFDGTLDTNFAGTGIITNSFVAGGSSHATALTVQGSGITPRKITVAGYGTSSGETYFGMDRFLADGSLDTSFGTGGRTVTPVGPTDSQAYAVQLQNDGKIVAAGYSYYANSVFTREGFGLARWNANGALDTSFGNGGDTASAVTTQPDGKIVVAGSSYDGVNVQCAAVRYNPDGSVDSSFGNGGSVLASFGNTSQEDAVALALDPAGRLVMAGLSDFRFGVMRLQGDAFLQILSITPLPNGHMLLTGRGFPNSPHSLQVSASLNSGFASVASVTADPTGAWQYDDATSLGQSVRFYRLSYP